MGILQYGFQGQPFWLQYRSSDIISV